MDKIKDIIEAVFNNYMAEKAKTGVDNPEDLLKKVLTKKELEHIKFNYFKKGLLVVSVDSSGWLYNLNLKKDLLCKNFKKELKGFKDLRLRIGEVK